MSKNEIIVRYDHFPESIAHQARQCDGALCLDIIWKIGEGTTERWIKGTFPLDVFPETDVSPYRFGGKP